MVIAICRYFLEKKAKGKRLSVQSDFRNAIKKIVKPVLSLVEIKSRHKKSPKWGFNIFKLLY